MDKIEGLFMVISEYNDGDKMVEGPFSYEQAIEVKNEVIMEDFDLFKSIRIAKLTFLD